MTWAWKQKLDPTDKFVLIALADHANDEDYTCWPSLNHLQTKTGFSRPTIWKTIDRLIKVGAVARVGESSAGSTKYKVMVGNEITLGNDVTQVTKLPKVGNDVNQVGNQVNKVGNHVTPNHQEPSRIITEPSGLDRNAWSTWFEYRKQIRKPLKPASILAAQRKLAAFGSDQAAVVEQSIANGWQGLFSMKNGGSHAPRERVDNSAPARVRAANNIRR